MEALIQRRDKPDSATFIGSGKVKEVREAVVATGADTVVCDGELSPAQLRTLEQKVKVKVIDRTALILDIFAHQPGEIKIHPNREALATYKTSAQ